MKWGYAPASEEEYKMECKRNYRSRLFLITEYVKKELLDEVSAVQKPVKKRM